MGFNYTILSPTLHDTAEASIKWFMDNWGIARKSIDVEHEFNSEVGLRPTFVANTNDHHLLCVEVSETVYANHLDAFVLACLRLGLPVKLYVASPKDTTDSNYAHNLRAAKKAGVGVIETSGSSANIAQEALSLSLNAVRPIPIKTFPPKYRQALSLAEQAFRSGTPEDACLAIYKEIEALSRKIIQKCISKGWWTPSGKLDVSKANWATLIKDWDRSVQRGAAACPLALSSALASKIHGITPDRNAVGHKPKDSKQLMKRDLQLRTRFEGACDLLFELVDASKPLKV